MAKAKKVGSASGPPRRLKRHPMTGWYDPAALLQTGIRVASATVFGEMIDRRELMAALDPYDKKNFQHFNFSGREHQDPQGGFWLDYCADTGDGWNPTYAVARLLARPSLEIDTTLRVTGDEPVAKTLTLPQARVLVFGGDQVYPTASRDAYREKLQDPFHAANKQETRSERLEDRYLFAIPGNHDWYDGLSSFTNLFCNDAPARPGSAASPGRVVCGRKTNQARGYFALQLPQNWWLFGLDAQLAEYIDAPQLRFFEFVSQSLMKPGSNIILSAAAPVWSYIGGAPRHSFENFAFVSSLLTGTFPRTDDKKQRRHNLRLVVSGDAHHYAHYTERGKDTGATVHYLTCGLGGAFLHPTHWLTSKEIDSRWPPPYPILPADKKRTRRDKPYKRIFALETDRNGKEVVYPDKDKSWWMSWRNFLFAGKNWKFSLLMAAVAGIVGWFLHAGAHLDDKSLIGIFQAADNPTLYDALKGFLVLLGATPWPILVVAAIGFALYYLADNLKTRWRIAMGVGHTIVHVLVYCGLLLVFGRWVLSPAASDFLLVAITSILEGVLAPTVLGLYLTLALNWRDRHWDEAFSALAIENFKGFLRLHIDKKGDLLVYPIVLDNVPSGDKAVLLPRLFEGPIHIPKSVT